MAEDNDEIVVSEDEDSVPSDFFDDFSNQDFMAGLDVVDVWDDDEPIGNKKPHDTAPGGKENKTKSDNKKPSTRNRRRSARRRRSRSRSRRKDKVEETSKRDPEKSRRDIQKDKDKWTKTNAAKLVSEKLKMVETGLVPPGTEMEVDLLDFQPTEPLPDLREKLRKRSPSFDLSTRLTNRNRSRGRKRSLSQVKSRSGSKHRHSWKKSRSRSRHITAIEYPSGETSYFTSSVLRKTRSPVQRPGSPFRYDNRWTHGRRNHYRRSSRSPERRTRRFSNTRSPSPSISEREHWLRTRDRSKWNVNDRRKNAPKDFLEELADKLKYDEKKTKLLHDISKRLNVPSTPVEPFHNQSFPPAAKVMMAPGPNIIEPRPNPSHNFQHHPLIMDPSPQYDQAFFIGQPEQFPNPNLNCIPTKPIHMQTQPLAQVSPLISAPVKHVPTIRNKQFVPVIRNQQLVPVNAAVKQSDWPTVQKEDEKKTASKLLEAKTLSLSDFLSVSAKYNGNSKPINVHKKVMVLSQCQDAIKSLGNTSKLSARFFYQKNGHETEKQQFGKCVSPLRKIPVVRFSFTTPGKGKEEKPFQTLLEKLMVSMNLDTKKDHVNDVYRSLSPLSSDSDVIEILSPEASVVTQPVVTAPVSAVTIRFQSKLSQTDVFKCEKCDIRNRVRYTQQGIQCNATTVDCGTQITDDDVNRFGIKPLVTGVVKKSLAHLTPAQLLGKHEPPQKFPVHQLSTPQIPPAPEMHRNINVGQRPTFIEVPHEFPNRYGSSDWDLPISGFNRNPEYQGPPGGFRSQRNTFDDHLMPHEDMRMPQHMMPEDNLRMHQDQMMRVGQRPFFQPPENIHHNFDPRAFY